MLVCKRIGWGCKFRFAATLLTKWHFKRVNADSIPPFQISHKYVLKQCCYIYFIICTIYRFTEPSSMPAKHAIAHFMSTLSADNDRNALSFKNSYPTHAWDFKPLSRGHRNKFWGTINRHFTIV